MTAPTPPPEELRAKVDVMIGNFVAQWHEAADGCMMDADTAQALAREFKRMRDLIYIPGVYRCAKCNLRLIQSTLHTQNGAVTARDEPGEKCPNDGSPMWRVTYRDDVAEAYDRWEEQVNRAVDAEKKLAALTPTTPAPDLEAVARELLAAEMLKIDLSSPDNGYLARDAALLRNGELGHVDAWIALSAILAALQSEAGR